MRERKRKHDDAHRPIKVRQVPNDTGYQCTECGSRQFSHLCSPRSKDNGLDKFAATVRRERNETGKSLRETAKLVGISHSTLSRIERAEDMSVVSFARVCMYFSLKPEIFLRLVIQERR